MGVIYRGERLRLGRPVAIKLLQQTIAKQKKFIQRFETEARALSRLGHPNCVSIIDFGVSDAPYLVMDYVHGYSLKEMLQRGKLVPSRAINIFRQILAALAHAHGHGIIHRDVKPGNIMLTEATGAGDHIRILDFGLAKLHNVAISLSVTSSPKIVATPAYMSPEQARGEEGDIRSDLYSAGVLLFELLTGKKPFWSDDTFDLLHLHLYHPPPLPRDVNPTVNLSVELEQVVLKALAKEPGVRYQTALEFAAALDETFEGAPSMIRTTDGQMILPRRHTANASQKTEKISAHGKHRLQRISMLGAASFVLVSLSLGLFFWHPWPRKTEAPWRKSQNGPEKTRRIGDPPSPLKGKSAQRNASALTAKASREGERMTLPQKNLSPPMDHRTFDAASDAPSDGGMAPPPLADAFAPPLGGDFPLGPEGTAVPEPQDTAAAELREELPEALPPQTAPPSKSPPASPGRLADGGLLLTTESKGEDLRALRLLSRQQPKNAHLLYLLGKLYFERRWWGGGLRYYQQALRLEPGYRRRRLLNEDAIEALSSHRTAPQAIDLLLLVGKSSLPYLQRAAKRHPYKRVRAQATILIKHLRSR
jgi:serine/threonine-protein kinase